MIEGLNRLFNKIKHVHIGEYIHTDLLIETLHDEIIIQQRNLEFCIVISNTEKPTVEITSVYGPQVFNRIRFETENEALFYALYILSGALITSQVANHKQGAMLMSTYALAFRLAHIGTSDYKKGVLIESYEAKKLLECFQTIIRDKNTYFLNAKVTFIEGES